MTLDKLLINYDIFCPKCIQGATKNIYVYFQNIPNSLRYYKGVTNQFVPQAFVMAILGCQLDHIWN